MDSAITGGIHRLGDEIVNSYLLEEAGSVTIVDAGVPGYWKRMPAVACRDWPQPGRRAGDPADARPQRSHRFRRACAARARPARAGPRARRGARARRGPQSGEGPRPDSPASAARLPDLVGAQRRAAPGSPGPGLDFGDGATLDVPGSPRVIHVPGHTPGSAALFVAARSTLFVGDALATYAVTTGVRGPQIAPFTADRDQAVASLARLEGLDARWVLPGHGPEWSDGIDAAVERCARRARRRRRPRSRCSRRPAWRPHGRAAGVSSRRRRRAS